MIAGSTRDACSPFRFQLPRTHNLPPTLNTQSRHSNRAQLNASNASSTVLLRTKLACAALASSLLLASPCGATDKPLSGAQSVPPGSTSQTTSSATESSPIRVIVALPITGARRSVGAAARQRLSLLKSAIDAAGGITNRPLQLEIEDDACTRDAARDLATRITAMSPQPAVVIGHPCATAAIAAAPIYQQAGVLFLAAGMRHPQLTEKRAGHLVFRAAGRDDRQGAEAGQRLRARAGDSGTALIIHDRTVLTRALAKAAGEAAAFGAKAPPAELTIVSGESDYSKLIDEIARREPQAILFAGFPSEAAIILKQLRARGLSVPFLVTDAMATAEFIDHAGDLLETDVEVMMPISINRDTLPESEMPDALVASDVTAALSVWVDAVTAIASTDASQIAHNLSSPRSHLDEIGFDSAGDAVARAFAPFARRGNVWQRADLPKATADDASPSQRRTSDSQTLEPHGAQPHAAPSQSTVSGTNTR